LILATNRLEPEVCMIQHEHSMMLTLLGATECG